MDHPRADVPVLERPGRRRIVAVTGVVLAGAAALGSALCRPGNGSIPEGPAWAQDGRVTAEVLNGSGRPGLARQVTRLLRQRDVDVIYFGTASAETDSTRILVRRGDLVRGHQAARALGQGLVSAAPDTLLRVDVTILLGRDYRPPAGAPPF